MITNYHMVLGILSFSIVYRWMAIIDDFSGYSDDCIKLLWSGLITIDVNSNVSKTRMAKMSKIVICQNFFCQIQLLKGNLQLKSIMDWT